MVVRIALAIVSDYFGAMGYDPGSADGQPDDMPDADLNEVDAPADTGADDED